MCCAAQDTTRLVYLGSSPSIFLKKCKIICWIVTFRCLCFRNTGMKYLFNLPMQNIILNLSKSSLCWINCPCLRKRGPWSTQLLLWQRWWTQPHKTPFSNNSENVIVFINKHNFDCNVLIKSLQYMKACVFATKCISLILSNVSSQRTTAVFALKQDSFD